MPRDSLIDCTFTSEEARILRLALLNYIVEERRTLRYLSNAQCHNMANAIRTEAELAERTLKLLTN